MPIRESQRSRYPANWADISKRIRERAGGACECRGECGAEHAGGRCAVSNHAHVARRKDNPAAWKLCRDFWRDGDDMDDYRDPIIVVLTVGHRNHQPEDNADANLAAWCQYCHNAHDRAHRVANIRATARARRAIGELF